MKILIIDNYDSFTYNLVQLIGEFSDDITVKRNDRVTVDWVEEFLPEKIVISPGPGRPVDSKISLDIIKYFSNIPILGVCLGHQAIGEIYGGDIINAPVLMHGKTSNIFHDGNSIYSNLEQGFPAGRYHSLIIDRATLPSVFEISSWTSDEIIMGIRHKDKPIEGIQFHPESILTPKGYEIIKNWMQL
jgi:anthranilate synthase/aminodeoxychorismate synthase-like glutamine amidotransferase